MEPTKKKLKILMGFSGTLDSVVGAYLLKKQGHEVYNIGINFYSEEYDNRRQVYDDKGEPLPFSPFQGIFQIKDLEKVKALSDALGIPFYAVQASNEYQHFITDRVVASRIGGRSFSPKVNASRLTFQILKQKAESLKADKISTGHYAKIVHNKALDSTQVFVSNDMDNDQSYLLSSLDPDVLDLLLLPLSDMRKSEVQKIAESLKLEHLVSERGTILPLMDRPNLGQFVAERSPKKMHKEGNLIDYKNETVLGDHDGIHNYGLGQDNVKTKTGATLDKDLEVIGFRYAAGAIFLGHKDDLMYDTIVMFNVKYSKGTDLSQPQEVFIKITERGEKIPATLFPMNNRYCELKLKEKKSGLVRQGDYIAFYNRPGTMGRVVGAGEVRTSGYVDFDKLRSFPKRKEELDEEENREPVDIYAFKF